MGKKTCYFLNKHIDDDGNSNKMRRNHSEETATNENEEKKNTVRPRSQHRHP